MLTNIMPIALWLLLGSALAYVVFKSGSTAAQSAALTSGATTVSPTGAITLILQGPAGTGVFPVPVESALPLALQTAMTIFFVNANSPSFTDTSVATFANQLVGMGYVIAAGSVASAWQMILAAMNATASSSASACPPNTHAATLQERIAGLKGCVPNASASAVDILTPTTEERNGVVFSKMPSYPVVQK